MKIQRLSEETINQIAAGEVIERPASVVKELVENSLDASSTNIEVIVEGAGRDRILVVDDGSGIDKEEIAISIERHATSKLQENNLNSIEHLGFRGEALPSIASVSRFALSSRLVDSDTGWGIKSHNAQFSKLLPVSINPGTRVEVRDLFYITPARLKFLKTDRTESAMIIETLRKLSIAYPDVSFSLIIDGRSKLSFKKKTKKSHKESYERIIEVIGRDFVENSIIVNEVKEDISINGLVSLPTFNRNSSRGQYIYVNGRPVADRLLSGAIRGAYRDYLPGNRFPVLALFLNLESCDVDVNVHPNKAEVRFRNERAIRSIIVGAIKKALLNAGFRSSNTMSSDMIGNFNAEIIKSKIVNNQRDDSLIHLANLAQNSKIGFAESNYNQELSNFSPIAKTYDMSIENIKYPLGAAVAQLHETYIVSQTKEGLVITDQHAAHERIVYEKFKKDLKLSGVSAQRLLIPEVVEMDSFAIDALMDHADEFKQLGLCVENFGSGALVVHETPAMLGEVDVKNLLKDLADDILNSVIDDNLLSELNKVCSTMACHGSIRAGRKMTVVEMDSLLRLMEETPNSAQCNHGRPTYIELKLIEIERLFGRK